MKKVLLIGLGGQGKKYIQFFIKNEYTVFGICKTQKTKDFIEKKYNIDVRLDYLDYDYHIFDIIVICLPPIIQGKVSLDILRGGYNGKMIIEIPVTWDESELIELKAYENAFFFLEEYYTLISTLLRRLHPDKIGKVDITITSNKDDYENKLARRVSYIHVHNNFLGTQIPLDTITYTFDFHHLNDIFYMISFTYKNIPIRYMFSKEKYLLVGNKKYLDNYNFDKSLSSIVEQEKNINKDYII